MRTRTAGLFLAAWMACVEVAFAVEPHSMEDFLRRDEVSDIQLAPDGAHYAIVMRGDDRSILNIVSRSDRSVSGVLNPGPGSYIDSFVWVSNSQVLLSVAHQFGGLDDLIPTGEIFSIDADGGGQKLLFGFRGQGKRGLIDKGRNARASAFVLDSLPDDEEHVLISVWPWTQKSESQTRVERMHIRNGKRKLVTKAPVPRARFLTDRSGVVRFATGAGVDNNTQSYYRADDDAEWELLNDESKTHRVMSPIGFSEDGGTAYLQVEEAEGPDSIYALDLATKTQTLALRGDFADPYRYLFSPDRRSLVGAAYMEGLPKLRYFDRRSANAVLYRTLAASFSGSSIAIDSATADGNLVLVAVFSDRSPGDYYLFDVGAGAAELVLTKSGWIDPRRTAEVRPVSLEARDGLTLHGYLTLPPGGPSTQMPMIVNPHGGPFFVADRWGYDKEVQMLAAAGYAVLQINFRGSGYYGREFGNAGAQEWGKAMQDDLTDATRWAISEQLADPKRICIYGASYGGYAALMGAAKEPDLYQCAVGYVGVYDLPLMHRRGDIALRRSGKNFLAESLGKQDLAANSPVNLADRIKAAVFLAAGGEDERAPVDHTEAMAAALERAGVPVQTLIYPKEGHGFFEEAHRREYAQRLVAFFDQHIGSGSQPAAE